jgi:hypothetical protein
MEHCKHEPEIAKMSEKLNKIEKAMYGNGQKGLIRTTTELNQSSESLSKSVNALATAVSALTQFRDETVGGIKAKERMRIHSQWMIGILLTVVLSLIGVILI